MENDIDGILKRELQKNKTKICPVANHKGHKFYS